MTRVLLPGNALLLKEPFENLEECEVKGLQ